MTTTSGKPRRRPSAALVVAGLALTISVTDAPAYARDLITGRDILDESVTGYDILDGSLGGQELIPNTVTGSQIADGSIQGLDLADETVTGREIKDGSVTSDDIQDFTIGTKDVQVGGIFSKNIANGAVTGTNIAWETITGSNIKDNSLDEDDLDDSLRHRLPVFVSVAANGSIESKSPEIASVTKLNDRPGHYVVTFTRNVSKCTFVYHANRLVLLATQEYLTKNEVFTSFLGFDTNHLVSKQGNYSFSMIGACPY